MENDVLMHHGILGMKWGIRRFQNKDGTRTALGKKRYNTGDVKGNSESNTDSKPKASSGKSIEDKIRELNQETDYLNALVRNAQAKANYEALSKKGKEHVSKSEGFSKILTDALGGAASKAVGQAVSSAFDSMIKEALSTPEDKKLAKMEKETKKLKTENELFKEQETKRTNTLHSTDEYLNLSRESELSKLRSDIATNNKNIRDKDSDAIRIATGYNQQRDIVNARLNLEKARDSVNDYLKSNPTASERDRNTRTGASYMNGLFGTNIDDDDMD